MLGGLKKWYLTVKLSYTCGELRGSLHYLPHHSAMRMAVIRKKINNSVDSVIKTNIFILDI